VRKALANELTVQTGRMRRCWPSITASMPIGSQSGHPVFPARLFREAAARLDADVLTVRHRGRAVASVLSLYHGGTVYPYWGGARRRRRVCAPTT
jgi:hypothetical protein